MCTCGERRRFWLWTNSRTQRLDKANWASGIQSKPLRLVIKYLVYTILMLTKDTLLLHIERFHKDESTPTRERGNWSDVTLLWNFWEMTLTKNLRRAWSWLAFTSGYLAASASCKLLKRRHMKRRNAWHSKPKTVKVTRWLVKMTTQWGWIERRSHLRLGHKQNYSGIS